LSQNMILCHPSASFQQVCSDPLPGDVIPEFPSTLKMLDVR